MDVEDPDLALTGEVLEGVRLYFFGGVLLVASAASPVLIKARARHGPPKRPVVWPVDKDYERAAPLRPFCTPVHMKEVWRVLQTFQTMNCFPCQAPPPERHKH